MGLVLLKCLETSRICEQLADQPPDLLGHVVHGGGRFALKEVHRGQEVLRAASVLQAGDELEKDAVDPVPDARVIPLNLPRVLLALVEQQGLHVVVEDGLAWDVEVTVPQCLQYAQTAPSAPAIQQTVLGITKRHDPGVPLRGGLLVLHVDALLREEVEPFRLHLGHKVRVRPGHVRNRPVGGGPAPDATAAKRRRDLDDVTLFDPQLDLSRVGDHLDHIPVAALVHGLRHQRLEARPDLPGAEVPRGRDELYPQGHGALPPVGELQHGAAGDRSVVHEVEDAHLVEVEDDLKLCG